MKKYTGMAFTFQEDYLLENEIVILSPLQEMHIEHLFKAANDEDIWRYFLENGYGKENLELFLLNAIQARRKGTEYPFVILDKRTNEYAGTTRIYDINNELRNVKIGHTWIGKQFQSTGLNKNCKYVLFEFLFDKLQMKRIGFGASAENFKSIHAMKSVGCKQEGVLRSFMPGLDENKRVDIVLMSILFEEWDANVRQALAKKIKLTSNK